MDPYGYFLNKNTIEAWHEPDEYAECADPDNMYGFPKGNLPSQWAGIIALNDYDHLMSNYPGCLAFVRFMDDGMMVFKTKEEARQAKNFTVEYLKNNRLGVRLNAKKTKYAPIKNGYTFVGWRNEIRADGTVKMKIRDDRKELKKKEFKTKQKLYSENKITWQEINDSLLSTFGHYKHGDTNRLIHYMSRQYVFRKEE